MKQILYEIFLTLLVSDIGNNSSTQCNVFSIILKISDKKCPNDLLKQVNNNKIVSEESMQNIKKPKSKRKKNTNEMLS